MPSPEFQDALRAIEQRLEAPAPVEAARPWMVLGGALAAAGFAAASALLLLGVLLFDVGRSGKPVREHLPPALRSLL